MKITTVTIKLDTDEYVSYHFDGEPAEEKMIDWIVEQDFGITREMLEDGLDFDEVTIETNETVSL